MECPPAGFNNGNTRVGCGGTFLSCVAVGYNNGNTRRGGHFQIVWLQGHNVCTTGAHVSSTRFVARIQT